MPSMGSIPNAFSWKTIFYIIDVVDKFRSLRHKWKNVWSLKWITRLTTENRNEKVRKNVLGTEKLNLVLLRCIHGTMGLGKQWDKFSCCTNDWWELLYEIVFLLFSSRLIAPSQTESYSAKLLGISQYTYIHTYASVVFLPCVQLTQYILPDIFLYVSSLKLQMYILWKKYFRLIHTYVSSVYRIRRSLIKINFWWRCSK